MLPTLQQKRFYTTGKVAKICGCASRTVTKWFEAGLLTGHRVPNGRGGGGDRRIHHDSLVKFMREHGIPLDGLDRSTALRVLVVEPEDVLEGPPLEKELVDKLGDVAFTWRVCQEVFQAGQVYTSFEPHVIIASVAVGRTAILPIPEFVRTHGNMHTDSRWPYLIALTAEDDGVGVDFLRAGFNAAYPRATAVQSLDLALRSLCQEDRDD